MPELRLVVDTNIPIAMVRNPEDEEAKMVMNQVFDGQASLLLGPRLWGEYQSGLWHPDSLKVRSADYLEHYLDALAEKAIYADTIPYQVAMEKNRKDEHVINLAVYQSADFVVTRDEKLLKLNDNIDWQEWYPAMKIIRPESFSQEVSLWQERRHEQEQRMSLVQAQKQERDFGPEF